MGQTAAELRVPLGIDVLTAARKRIADSLDHAERVYLSFSGGKDSTVMLHLVMDEAIRRGRKVGVLFVDLEGQYKLTIEHIERCLSQYGGHIEEYWVSLPINLRNAISQYEPQWLCWDPERESDWIRRPPERAIMDEEYFPFFRRGMEFEDFVPEFAEWYSDGKPTVCFVGVRSDESLNRWRSLASDTKERYNDWSWTTVKGDGIWNAYPIYDWRTEDIWVYHARHPEQPHNELYDRMQMAGLPIHQQRICQPYGDDQKRGLWLYHVIEPETWGRVVARVNGANAGALYARESGRVTGAQKITLPEGHTWESFANLLLGTMPKRSAEHFRNKIAVFLKWWSHRNYPSGIPDEADERLEAARKVPSWRRVVKVLLRNDYWCKGLSFSQHASRASYARYKTIMRERRREWGVMEPTAGIMGRPTVKQLALLAALTDGNNPDHAYRALGAAIGRSKTWAKKHSTTDDASEAIDVIKQTDAEIRKERYGQAAG